MINPILEVGETCYTMARIDEARVLVDAAPYYAAFFDAAREAKRSICLTGWQFDTRARIVPAEQAGELESRFLPFLNQLCQLNPELHVFITAWNYSVFYAIEREWFQNLRFGLEANERIHFRFLDHPNPGGAHHEKIVTIDDQIAFSGGIDVCDERWDDSSHLAENPARVNAHGDLYGPFHDVQVAVTGPAVEELAQLFWESWVAAGGEASDRPQIPQAMRDSSHVQRLRAAAERHGRLLRCKTVGLSRTRCEDESTFEVERLYAQAIASADQLIYIENQYFTSRSVVQALAERMSDSSRAKLQLVIVMPDGGHSKKEQFVLGKRQRLMLSLVTQIAREHGHEVRVVMSRGTATDGAPVSTYIHSKVMIVDDSFLTIGSANLMNRSMRVDHELNLSFDAALGLPEEAAPLQEDIRGLRASLLAEHAGSDDARVFAEAVGLVHRIDERCADPTSKLVCHELREPEKDDPVLIAFFDPAGPIDWASLNDAFDQLFDADNGPAKGAARKLGQRLGVVDVEKPDDHANAR